ncbi:hypothetical protein BC828DRAFT_101695 [Blastocladiella britannica]|nr:hypothetical protein BC828DRAFT_101695 [Blastocladiella britannica]
MLLLPTRYAVTWPLTVAVAVVAALTALTLLLRSTAYPTTADPTPSPDWLHAFSTAAAVAHIEKLAVAEHPMPSAANWAVRNYILDQAQRVADSPEGKVRGVRILARGTSNDNTTTTTDGSSTWTSFVLGDKHISDLPTGSPMFLEDSNVYVRIPGRNEINKRDRSALLLSAHFDTVPTARGVGDNSIAVSAALEIMRIATAQPLDYTLLINFNNGEELGLLGAHVMINSPIWSEVAAFINCDSVCPTGRPMLYRATSRELVKQYKKSAQYPHGNVIGQEIMAAGLVRSNTDFSVYALNNATGIDFAFYDRRWVYHTDRDAMDIFKPESVAHLGNDILAVLAGVNATGLAPVDTAPEKRHIVYMDFVGRTMMVASYPLLASLAIGTAAVAVAVAAGMHQFRKHRSISVLASSSSGSTSRTMAAVTAGMIGAMLATIAAPMILLFVTFKIQRYAVSGRPMLVMAAAATASLAAAAGAAWVLTRGGGVFPSAAAVRAHRALAGIWVGLLVVSGIASLFTGFGMHLYWFGAFYALLALAVDPLLRAAESRVPVATKQHDGVVLETTTSEKVAPSRARILWLLVAHFALASSWPAVVAADLALMYLLGLSFNVQEGMNPIIIAGFATVMAFPVTFNTTPVLMAAGRRASGRIALVLATAAVVMAAVLAAAFPYTRDAPLKIFSAYGTTVNGTVTVGGGSAAAAAVVKMDGAAMVPKYSMYAVPTSRGVPEKLAASIPGLTCVEDALGPQRQVCSVMALSLGFPSALSPSIDVQVSTTTDAATVVLTVAPGILTCAMMSPPSARTAPAAPSVAIYSASLNATLPSGNKTTAAPTLPMPSGMFTAVAGNPTTSMVARLAVPLDWFGVGGALRCNLTINDGAPSASGEPLAIYKKLVSSLPEWATLTANKPRGLGMVSLNLDLVRAAQ